MPERTPSVEAETAVPSFVGEMLATVGKLEKEDLAQRIGQLSERIDSIKSDVHQNLGAYYQDFYADLAITQDLSGRVDSVASEMKTLTEKIEKEIHGQLLTTTREYADFSEKMGEMDSVVRILDTLVECHEALEASKRNLASGSYVECAENLDKLKKLVEGVCDKNIKILESLHVEVTVQNENLVYQLGEKWRETVVLDVPTDLTSRTNVHDNIVLTIDKSSTRDLLKAMHKTGVLDDKLRHLADRLMEYVLTDLVKGRGNVTVKQKVTACVLTMEKSEMNYTPRETFEKIGQVLEFLSKDFLDVKFGGGNAMQILGGHLGNTLVDLIVKECLAVAVPTNQKDLESFAKTVKATEKFQKFLEKNGVKDSNALVSYVSNVNTLFANKKCQITLERARVLMKSEIHNMVQIVDNSQTNDENKGLNVNMMKFPDCYISTSVQELMQLAYDLLAEACTSDEQCGMQLFYCVRNMFELFCAVVPTYHQRSFEELPQLAALYHNNCMYVSHHLTTLGHQFRNTKVSKQGITFLDLVQKIRQQGIECFLAQMRRQRDQMNEFLALADGFISIADPSHNQSAERAVKQVFFQLNRLQNVWQDVLPRSVYWKSMGTLLNSCLDEIMRQVIALDDISADDAEQLHGLTMRITEQTPALFNKDRVDLSLIVKYVPQWVKFTEFQMVLNARLAEIAERWASGQGPLAAQFKANEIKQLIRALYQNTEIRANVLAQI